jgi:hypothetical protein
MRTKVTIMTIILAALLTSIGVLVTIMLTLGPWVGLGVGVGLAAILLTAYFFLVQPWHSRWGATDEEVGRSMPGDRLLPDATSTTRAITIEARPEDVWPWLVQIGYGRAGWYSYDWIDNDGRPSADRILPELQSLKIGDRILMVPGMGPLVKAIEQNRYILSGGEADSWCLCLYPIDEDTRLVSRWRADWPKSLATFFWVAISDPGAFIMERKMLKGIKRRVEATAGQPRGSTVLAAGNSNA